MTTHTLFHLRPLGPPSATAPLLWAVALCGECSDDPRPEAKLTDEEAQAIVDQPARTDAKTLLHAMAHPSSQLVVADVNGDGMEHAREAAKVYPELARQVPPHRWCAADPDLLDADAVGPVEPTRDAAFVHRVLDTLRGPLGYGHFAWLARPDIVCDADLPAILDHIHDQLRQPDHWIAFLAVVTERQGLEATASRLARVSLGTVQALLTDLPAELVAPALTHPARLEALEPYGENADWLYGLVRKYLASDPAQDPAVSLALVRAAPQAWWAGALVLALAEVHGAALCPALQSVPRGASIQLDAALRKVLDEAETSSVDAA